VVPAEPEKVTNVSTGGLDIPPLQYFKGRNETSLALSFLHQKLQTACSGFIWDRGKFLHSRLYGAMFWICKENSVYNTGTIKLLLNSAYTVPRSFLPHQQIGWGYTRRWERTQLGQLMPASPEGYSIPYDVVFNNKNCGKKEGLRDIWSYGVCLPKSLSCVMEPALLEWNLCFTSACQQEVVNEFIILLCLCAWLLRYLFNYLVL